MPTPAPSQIAAAVRRRELSPRTARGWLMAYGMSEAQAQDALRAMLKVPPAIGARPRALVLLCAGWFLTGAAWVSIAWWWFG